MKRFLLATSLGCVLISCTHDTGPEPKAVRSNNTLSTAQDSMVDGILRPYVSGAAIAGASLTLVDGNDARSYHYGETRLGNGTLPGAATRYELGDVTQTFTAALLLSWLQSGNRSADDYISAWLPADLAPRLRFNNGEVTFRQLLNHCSGLPRLTSDLLPGTDPYRGYDSTRLYGYIATHYLLHTPGILPATEVEAREYYSPLAYALAGTLLERQTGQPLQQLLESTLLSPLGMSATTIDGAGSDPAAATPHNNNGPVPAGQSAAFAGAVGLRSTSADMTRYLRAQLAAGNSSSSGGSTVPGIFLLATQIPVVQVGGRDYFGMGWQYYFTRAGRIIVYKEGSAAGSSAWVAFDRDSRKGLVLLCNNGPDGGSGRSAAALMEAFFR
ncbi:serine hydrolase domain-containing protein [Flaviaesturariibacter aridisoli]|uniref:Class A beta-lactamase-related serine hydrolase n=1 Tax=Flaviaesturariibacter aridisoli TaxID=2545761 RepID=A0A4R4DUX9_9BACT|nr:serine hydrolase domain-containing protein [Flaviaesturariibacter aridisoli]TCZ66942.1 class A beta-lactamase-related serine hydrolase [Flaviaesturariibacter aridisoli]